jgi:SAM-dependent methyltransferase
VTRTDPKDRFTGLAADYERFRPSYPRELVDWILARAGVRPGDLVADLGCGTGITTRLFAERGLDAVGIDPNADMLAEARRYESGRYVQGEAAATGLSAGSAALAVAGQAFHWFDFPSVTAELKRILRPAGWCAAFWNTRASGPFLDGYEELLHRHCAGYARLAKGPDTLRRLEVFPDFTRAEFPNPNRLSFEQVVGRARSSSYVALDLKDKPAIDRELEALFKLHQKDGAVDFPYKTIVGMWRP